MNPFTLFETNHWTISHRTDSRYPGYLIISSREETLDISALTKASLAEMGDVLAETEQLLTMVYNPYKVITAKMGFTKGFSCHFHMIPVMPTLLDQIAAHSGYAKEPDGIDAMLFICREYCERSLNETEMQTMDNTIALLRKKYQKS